MANEQNIEYPFEYQELNHDETEELLQYFNRDYFTKFIRLGSAGYFLYKEFDQIAVDIYRMPVRSTDVFVVTYPRSGTTWTQELVWLLNNDCDFERAKDTLLPVRFPYLESGGFRRLKFPEFHLNDPTFSKFMDENISDDPDKLFTMASPRFIKSHMPLSLLPPSLLDTAKVVYVARDPRDVVVSNFFHAKNSRFIPEGRELKDYWNFFIQNKILLLPFFEHLMEAWRQRNHPNMTFIFYEELTKDLPGVARRLAKFFGKEYSDQQFEDLVNHLKFDNFKNNRSVNMEDWQKSGIMTGNFIRRGKSGGWRDHFDAEMTQQAERWMQDNLKDTDLRFPNVPTNIE